MGSLSAPVSLDVIVVGGGIGGLAAAIALRRAGHHVTVFEKYAADADAGAGIVVCANAGRVLKQWGLDLEGAGMLKYQRGYILNGKTLEVAETVYGEESNLNKESDNGEAQHMAARQDVRILLRREAETEREGQGTVEFRYESEVVEYDADRPAVKFASGNWVEADLVVACDGIRSKAAKVICGGENPAKSTGRSAFRLLIPDQQFSDIKEKFKDNNLIRDRFDISKPSVWFARDQQQLLVWWMCRFGQLHAFDIIMLDNDKYISKEEWTARCDKRVLIDQFAHWHPLFQEVFEAAESNPSLWKICFREPLETVHKGKLCMLGDALHPMPPFRAQGASQSIEDAGALEMVLSNLKDRSELPRRLALLGDLRVPRFACAQMLSTVRQDELNMDQRYIEVMDQCRKWFEGKDQSHCKS